MARCEGNVCGGEGFVEEASANIHDRNFYRTDLFYW